MFVNNPLHFVYVVTELCAKNWFLGCGFVLLLYSLWAFSELDVFLQKYSVFEFVDEVYFHLVRHLYPAMRVWRQMLLRGQSRGVHNINHSAGLRFIGADVILASGSL